MDRSDTKPAPDPPEQSDPLSATGMFLRAFESNSEPTPQSPNPVPEKIEATPAMRAAEPGEFTRMFKSGEAPQSSSPAPAAGRETPKQPESTSPNAPARAESQPAPNHEPGEFTRIFVAGMKPPIVPAKFNEGQPRSAPGSPSAKGFSSPGSSDSASADGSFSRLFKTAETPQASSPPLSAQFPSAPPSPPAQNISWKNEPVLDHSREPIPNLSQSSASSPSATNLLDSLSSPRSLQSEPTPYRPDPVRSSASPSRPETPGGIDSGGVTRLIQKLTQEPPAPPINPIAPPAASPMNSGPGEFTRMISSIGGNPAIPPTAPAPAQPAGVQFTVPAPPQVALPARPSAPAIAPPAITPPAMPIPKAAAPAPAIVPAAKSKFEALVPILLIFNTFLLIVLLLVVIFSMKAR